MEERPLLRLISAVKRITIALPEKKNGEKKKEKTLDLQELFYVIAEE